MAGLKVNINIHGVIFSIGEESTDPIPPVGITNLIDVLTRAQSDIKDLIEIERKKDALLKNYNCVGIHITK